jgi:hypothetical protein
MKPVLFRVSVVVVGLLLVGSTRSASAQMLQSTDLVFAGVNFGNQTKARTFTTSGSQPLYDETATFESSTGIGSARIFDISAGVRVWSNLAIGAGFSKYTDSSSGTLNASVPDPLFFDTPHAQSFTAEGLEHEQQQIHLSLYWLQPVTDRFDVSLYAGPTFFSVKQDLQSGIAVASGTSTITSVTTTTVDESTTGYHLGLDFRYLFIQNAGLGAFVRYTSGSVDASVVDGGKIDVGGFQYGVGLRVRF